LDDIADLPKPILTPGTRRRAPSVEGAADPDAGTAPARRPPRGTHPARCTL